MDIYCLNSVISNFYDFKATFIIKFISVKDIWIFNCREGFQYFISHNQYKINNISKIILTDMHVINISGLMGLLSSLSLIGRVKPLHIYASKDLVKYISLCRKYSHTNFCYMIYIHCLKNGLIISQNRYRIYAFSYNLQFQFIIMQSEQAGTFILNKAKNNYLTPGPIYGKLKQGLDFVLPDGSMLNGNNFTLRNLHGMQISFLLCEYYNRISIENITNSKILFY